MITELVTEGKREKKWPCQKITLRWVKALASARKGM